MNFTGFITDHISFVVLVISLIILTFVLILVLDIRNRKRKKYQKIFKWWHPVLAIYALGLSGSIIIIKIAVNQNHHGFSGPYPVYMRTLSSFQGISSGTGDPIINRVPQLICWYPVMPSNEPLPVILFFPSTRLQGHHFSSMARRLASHGFFVVISKDNINPRWRYHFSGKWKRKSADRPLSAEEILHVVRQLENLDLADTPFKSGFLLDKVYIGTRMSLSMDKQEAVNEREEGFLLTKGLLIATVEISESQGINFVRKTIIPFKHVTWSNIGVTNPPDGLFHKMIVLISKQVHFQRILPVRMISTSLGRLREWSGTSYINICESVLAQCM